MRKSLSGILSVIIAAVFISACAGDTEPDEREVSGGVVSIEENGNENSENESGGYYGLVSENTLEETESEEIYFDWPILLVHYNGHDYMQYAKNPWWDRDEEWLNENYVYITYAEFYSKDAYMEYCSNHTSTEDDINFTTIPTCGCDIYRCNDEDTFILGFWEDDEAIILMARTDLSAEEKESASAATDWKR